MTARNTGFLLYNIVVLIIFYGPMSELIISSFQNELYSHVILIPFVSGYFIFSERKTIFSDIEYKFTPGIVLILAGSILCLIGLTQGIKLDQNNYLSLMTLSAVTLWIGGFILFYGIQAFRNASFPLLLLIFMIPMPSLMADNIIYILQSASAEVSYGYFKLIGIPIYREEFVFHLPGVTVEVAKECSGIRSTIALFITGILAGHLFLKTGWKKAVLALSIFPIAILKNGVRIVALSLLGAYVDMSYLTDSLLHRKGGLPFFILALLLLSPVVWLLRKTEKAGIDKQRVSPGV
jgi:exosortase